MLAALGEGDERAWAELSALAPLSAEERECLLGWVVGRSEASSSTKVRAVAELCELTGEEIALLWQLGLDIATRNELLNLPGCTDPVRMMLLLSASQEESRAADPGTGEIRYAPQLCFAGRRSGALEAGSRAVALEGVGYRLIATLDAQLVLWSVRELIAGALALVEESEAVAEVVISLASGWEPGERRSWDERIAEGRALLAVE